ncbi:hypothetical protein [Armatimonas sp.]|uniref:hypothetical protein n=1 Tax=Armatimonas sp. TaxID=1872638 RepID=UPI00286D33BA|nr:hypothetical protein [Armatimonas sp.]
MPKPLTDEEKLIEKLRRIEALYARPGTAGEREAAGSARERILARLAEIEKTEALEEFRLTLSDRWAKQLFLALLRRYNLEPYRYHGQKYTTVMVKATPTFMNETIWPEYQALYKTLEAHLEEVTQRVVAEALHSDTSDISPSRKT